MRLPGTDVEYCASCTRSKIDGDELSGVKDRLDALLKANDIGVNVRKAALPST